MHHVYKLQNPGSTPPYLCRQCGYDRFRYVLAYFCARCHCEAPSSLVVREKVIIGEGAGLTIDKSVMDNCRRFFKESASAHEALEHELGVFLHKTISDYDNPATALSTLIEWHIKAATDPRVNGGKVLVDDGTVKQESSYTKMEKRLAQKDGEIANLQKQLHDQIVENHNVRELVEEQSDTRVKIQNLEYKVADKDREIAHLVNDLAKEKADGHVYRKTLFRFRREIENLQEPPLVPSTYPEIPNRPTLTQLKELYPRLHAEAMRRHILFIRAGKAKNAVLDYDLLINAFCWNDTPQGDNFWGLVDTGTPVEEIIEQHGRWKDLFRRGG